MPTVLSVPAIFAAVFCVITWGFNSIAIKIGLQRLDVSTFNFLRFLIVIPFIFFVPRPQLPWGRVALAAFFWNILNFAFLGCALKAGIPPGTLMFIFQANVFFSVFFGKTIFKEAITKRQVVSMIIGFLGVGLLCMDVKTEAMPIIGIIFVLLSAACSSFGVSLAKSITVEDKFSLNIWLNFITFMGFAVATLFDDGFKGAQSFLLSPDMSTVLCLLFTGVLSTTIANFVWVSVLKTNDLSKVVPFMTLIPVVALLTSTAVFDEAITSRKCLAFAIILGSVIYGQIRPRALIKSALHR